MNEENNGKLRKWRTKLWENTIKFVQKYEKCTKAQDSKLQLVLFIIYQF